MTSVRFDAHAIERVGDDSARYDEEELGLGARFEAAVLAAAELLATAPRAGRRVAGDPDLRRWNVEVFPYSLLYAEEPDGVVILFVVHHRRRPGSWRDE